MRPHSNLIKDIISRLDAPASRHSIDEGLEEGIYLYGAGELGSLALDYCEACGIKVLGFLDRFRTSAVVSSSRNAYPVY